MEVIAVRFIRFWPQNGAKKLARIRMDLAKEQRARCLTD